MSEFKIQIISLLLVIAIFSLLLTQYKTFIQDTWQQVAQQMKENPRNE